MTLETSMPSHSGQSSNSNEASFTKCREEFQLSESLWKLVRCVLDEHLGHGRSAVKYLQHFYLSVFKAAFSFSPYSKATSSLKSPIFMPPAQYFLEVWISFSSHHQFISEDFGPPCCSCCDISLAESISAIYQYILVTLFGNRTVADVIN